MIRRIKLPGWIVLFFLLVSIILGINQVIATVFEDTPEPNEPKESIEENVEFSVYPGLNIKTTTRESELYTLSISLPYTDNEHINQSLNEWIDEQKEAFTSAVKDSTDMLEKNDFRAHLNIQVETSKIADRLYSLEFQSYQITGGANGITKLKPFMLDLNNNKQLELDDVFQIDEKTTSDIRVLIEEELHSNQDINLYLFDDMLKESLTNPDKWEWSINQDLVTFYFDQHEIAAGVAGSIKAEIPIDKIKPYLNEEFAELIDVELPEEEEEQDDHLEGWAKLDEDGKYVALTFDDGPHPDVTPRILDTLKKHDAKATFFMLGSQVEYYPSLANQVKEAGHEIANHTMNHHDLSILNSDQIKEEMQQSSKIIKKATGWTSTLLRPPYGALNSDVKQIGSDLGYSLVLWSVDSLDWKSRDAAAVNEEVMSHVTSGSIVLLHDIHSSTADALPQLLTSLTDQGYQMVTVSQLLELWNEKGVGPHYGKADY